MEIIVWWLHMQSGLSYIGVSCMLVAYELNWEETSNMIYGDTLIYRFIKL